RPFFSERKKPWRVCARCVNPCTISATEGYEAKSVLTLYSARVPVVSSPSSTPPPVLGMNLYPTTSKVVYVASILYAVTRPSVLLAGSFLAVAAVEISVSVSESPVGSLVDAAIRHASGGDGFGSQRLWGAVGFGIASLVAGYVSDLYGG
ncbi:unnamed protein product, partial [Ectocarpus sp. 8 AP-2014]